MPAHADNVRRGSSPHTRGALRVVAAEQSALGIIPAYAGSTWSILSQAATMADHPRIRGEHVWSARHGKTREGSSPHTRGAPHEAMAEYYEGRIIPAYAGSTPGPRSDRRPFKDHPRIRGEHYGDMSAYELSSGSSPHTRGALTEFLRMLFNTRIIPAYAGSTTFAPAIPVSRRDHPRIRGEHVPPPGADKISQGSSPHTRGARGNGGASGARIGIIPAYAGSTGGPRRPARTAGDHPRIRGEHEGPWKGVHRVWGSSPHTRGARVED